LELLFEALHNLFTLNIQFFIDWFSGSFFLLFAITALMYFFGNKKNTLRNIFLFILVIFCWIQFQELSGFIIMGTLFLSLNYVLKLAILKTAESTPVLSNKLALVNWISFVVLLVVVALFVGF
jgi:hypothetical protein